MLLLRARETAMDYFRPSLYRHGLTEQQWRVLRALNESRSMTAAQLAASCLILPPSMTRILRAMTAAKLIRSRKQGDQRQRHVSLSERGRKLLACIGPESERQYQLMRDRLPPEHLHSLYALLKEFVALGAPTANHRDSRRRSRPGAQP